MCFFVINFSTNLSPHPTYSLSRLLSNCVMKLICVNLLNQKLRNYLAKLNYQLFFISYPAGVIILQSFAQRTAIFYPFCVNYFPLSPLSSPSPLIPFLLLSLSPSLRKHLCAVYKKKKRKEEKITKFVYHFRSSLFSVKFAKIVGSSEIYVKVGSTISLTCVVNHQVPSIQW
jgi:hypothetical protein